jgi:hypothetical protein
MEGAIQTLREEQKPGEVSLVVPELTGIMRSDPSDRILTMVISTAMKNYTTT